MHKINDDSTLSTQRQLLKDRGICVIIPTYNNAGTIVDVVNRAKVQCDDVIVVCDGATDGTLNLLQQIDNITIVQHHKNKGKGAALKSGFEKALAMGFAYAITLDADGQHFPEDISILLNANIEYPGAMLIGERKDLEKMERSKGSKFANKFSNFWFFVQTGKNLKDTQTGYRLYPLKKLYGLGFLTSRYEAELELMVFAAWHGVEIQSIPVNVYYPSREERVSHFKPALDFTRISILNTILCVLAVVYALPLFIVRKLIQLCVTIYGMSFFFFSSLLILTPATMFYMALGGDKLKKQRKLRRMLYRFARFIMVWHGVPRVKFRAYNSDRVNRGNASVIICNHQSHLDLMALMAEVENIVFMTNNWVWNSPLFGYVIRKAGYILAAEGVEFAEQQVKAHLANGVNVAIFPEGTRSIDCKIMRFHSGAFHLAKALNADIVPAILYGAGKVLPKKAKFLRPGVIEIHFDEKIDVKSLVDQCGLMRGVASYVRKYYQKRYAEISNKLEQNA